MNTLKADWSLTRGSKRGQTWKTAKNGVFFQIKSAVIRLNNKAEIELPSVLLGSRHSKLFESRLNGNHPK
jgi:hypothetical protein